MNGLSVGDGWIAYENDEVDPEKAASRQMKMGGLYFLLPQQEQNAAKPMNSAKSLRSLSVTFGRYSSTM
ncbi:unnamed protein product [Boreogadus saida]